jgi:hypothetical protein
MLGRPRLLCQHRLLVFTVAVSVLTEIRDVNVCSKLLFVPDTTTIHARTASYARLFGDWLFSNKDVPNENQMLTAYLQQNESPTK